MSNFREFKIWALVIILTNSFNFFVYMAYEVIKWSIINDLKAIFYLLKKSTAYQPELVFKPQFHISPNLQSKWV